MDDKHESHEGDAFSHNFNETDSRRLIETAYFSEEVRARATSVISKALGDLPPLCPSCGELCDEHSIKLRDAFFVRTLHLAQRLVRGLDLYAQEREFGIVEPIGTINSIYRVWAELSVLHDLVEPQARDVNEAEMDDGDSQE